MTAWVEVPGYVESAAAIVDMLWMQLEATINKMCQYRLFVCHSLYFLFFGVEYSNLFFLPPSGELYRRPDPCHHGQEGQHP